MNAAREYAAPMGSTTRGGLEFVRGAANATIRSDEDIEHLYRASLEGTGWDIGVEGDTITVKYPRSWRKLGAAFALNRAIPWRIVVNGGIAEFDGVLDGIRLDSFQIKGGAHAVVLTLAEPVGTVPVRIEGGANDVKILRPRGTAASLFVGGGASKLAFDNQYLGAVGGETRLESPGYAEATDRYEITITSGANDVALRSR